MYAPDRDPVGADSISALVDSISALVDPISALDVILFPGYHILHEFDIRKQGKNGFIEGRHGFRVHGNGGRGFRTRKRADMESAPTRFLKF